MEFIRLVFKFGLIFRNLFQYLGLSGLVFSEFNLTGSQRLISFFKLCLIVINLSLQFLYHCLKALDRFFSQLRFFGEFADIVSLVQMLNIAPLNTITTFQSVLTTYLFIK